MPQSEEDSYQGIASSDAVCFPVANGFGGAQFQRLKPKPLLYSYGMPEGMP